MKNNRNKLRNRILVLGSALALVFLLYLLTVSEKRSPDATIRTPWDALWYFLSTITTVGYGDVSPVTPFGKMLGVIFILLSCGFITVLITATISFMNSSFILKIRIALARVDKWYIFDEYGPESGCLASSLCDLPENSGIIFCGAERQIRGLLKFRHIFTPQPVQTALALCRENLDRKSANVPMVFLIGRNEEQNLKTALELRTVGVREKPAQIYCRTCVRFQTAPEGLHTFDPAELTARSYWEKYPLTSSEKDVVLIGNGSLLNYILEQAVLVNVFGPLMRCRYHIFSENENDTRHSHKDESFLADHPRIGDTLTVVTTDGQSGCDIPAGPNAPFACGSGTACGESPDNDTLIFHEEHWDTNHGCLETADRIIICSHSEIDNIRMAEKIRLLCATKAPIHICGTDSIDGVTGFGGLGELYTPEQILREELLRRARTLNEYYNSLQEDVSKKTCWENLSTFTCRSNMAAADHMSTKLRILTDSLDRKTAVPSDSDTTALAFKNFNENVINRELCRRIEHERWMRFHSLYGWTYGEVRDNARRRHPLMVPFEKLTLREQELDDISWELINTLEDDLT